MPGDRPVRFPAKSWSEDIAREDEGQAEFQTLLRKGILKRDPLANLPVAQSEVAPTALIADKQVVTVLAEVKPVQVTAPVIRSSRRQPETTEG